MVAALMAGVSASAQTTRLAEGWRFAFGNAADPAKDFGCGTEYFNYLTKANSIHNEGPYSAKFDDSTWQEVTIPHDWVCTLPYAPEASHSHGYKTVGWKYPETSVGWYRLRMSFVGKSPERHYRLRFGGIFRNSTVWFNGYYMGTEPSGYAVQEYDITPYIDFEGDNILCVRADASLEEGWFYEGAGIYRDVWLEESGPVHPTPGGIWTYWTGSVLKLFMQFENTSAKHMHGTAAMRLLDADGTPVWEHSYSVFLAPQQVSGPVPGGYTIEIDTPHLWSPEDPYLYTLETTIGADVYRLHVGLRTAEFNATDGFLLNGQKLVLHGVNLHQDHAGVGAAVPEDLMEWRIRELKKYGVNAIRCSHNPASPVLLDICDRLGVMVIDENRLMGVNTEHKRLLENMVVYGRQHPSVILWSVGNEEWGLENDVRGARVARQMQDYVHILDPSRQTTLANAGGGVMFQEADVKGYNYIIQNDVENRHSSHPEWIAYGSEETTGCGTRGVYYHSQPGDSTGQYVDSSGLSVGSPCHSERSEESGHMPSINRTGSPANVIERGWQYYRNNPWTGGVFFWTGLDYRGEPNPLQYPAHDSEFGLLDYCGFPKDEAFYLKAAWTSEPVLHILPHWNLSGHEGESVDIWVYSNCDEVSLSVNGRSLGRKKMPRDGHLSWTAKYKKGKIVADGYLRGKRVLRQVVETTGPAVRIATSCARIGDITVVNVELRDAKGRFVPDACPSLTCTIDGSGHIIGAGNGDPSYLGPDNPGVLDAKSFTIPAFNGRAQFLVQGSPGNVVVSF